MSILNQVRKDQFQKNLLNFNPVETLKFLLNHLNEREREIIKRRHGLLEKDKKYTLEEIGQNYQITRERVRQIENLSVKKLKKIEELKEQIEEAEKVIVRLLEQYGGTMEEVFFLDNILNYLEDHPETRNSLIFLMEHIFSDRVSRIKADRKFNNLWKMDSADLDFLKGIVSEMTKIINQAGQPLDLKKLLEEFKKSDFYRQSQNKIFTAAAVWEAEEKEVDNILENYLRTAREIRQDLFGNWGLLSWGVVRPRKINDKIYLVIKKSGRPLHFTEIAKAINETGFDEKIAYPPTVHNELILDDKYVLVGRGIYALKEWGYQPGNVSEVIRDILEKEDSLTKKEIIKKVLEKRNVKESTVYLSLTNNKNIKRLKNGRYTLVNQENQEKKED